MRLRVQEWRRIAISVLLLVATPTGVSSLGVIDWNAITVQATVVAGHPGATDPVDMATDDADPASDWNAIAERATAIAGHAPPVAAIDFAIVQLAIHDAIMAIDRRYQPYHVQIPYASGSMIAAGAKAGHDILVHLFPNQAGDLDADYEAYLTQHNISPTDPGIEVGAQAAAGIADLRSNDGRFPPSPPPYLGSAELGKWRPTPSYEPGGPPSNASGLTPWVADVRPFTFDYAADYTTEGPLELTSARYAADFNEVKSLGSKTSTTRTPEQTQLGYFWADSGPVMWQRALRDISKRYQSNPGDSARMFALVSLSLADASIACWSTKYHFSFWRPITAIALADQDGNKKTEADPNWRPLVNTPNFPEYTSGHATTSAAAAETLKKLFGTNNLEFTMTTANGLANPKTRVYYKLSDAVNDVVDARVYVGIHFRTADVHGVKQGERVGKHVFKHYLREAGHGQEQDENHHQEADNNGH